LWSAEGLEVVVPPKGKSANKGKAKEATKEVTKEAGLSSRARAPKKRGM
jgi:hypothetical protein